MFIAEQIICSASITMPRRYIGTSQCIEDIYSTQQTAAGEAIQIELEFRLQSDAHKCLNEAWRTSYKLTCVLTMLFFFNLYLILSYGEKYHRFPVDVFRGHVLVSPPTRIVDRNPRKGSTRIP